MGLTFVTEDQPDLTLPEDSVHTAKLLEIKPRTINWTTDDLIGLRAEISIGHRQDKKDALKVWEYVDEVMPVDGGFDLNEPPF
jgi:hypothetical protein